MLAYDQAHFSALVSMEQKENAKEQGASASAAFSLRKTELGECRMEGRMKGPAAGQRTSMLLFPAVTYTGVSEFFKNKQTEVWEETQ